jgi:hypothetical protein
VNKAQRFYHAGTQLKQVADFYNSIGNQIIQSQMPMLLKDADDFEKVVQGKSITWGDEKALHGYLSDLKAAKDRLAGGNPQTSASYSTWLYELTVALTFGNCQQKRTAASETRTRTSLKSLCVS